MWLGLFLVFQLDVSLDQQQRARWGIGSTTTTPHTIPLQELERLGLLAPDYERLSTQAMKPGLTRRHGQGVLDRLGKKMPPVVGVELEDGALQGV